MLRNDPVDNPAVKDLPSQRPDLNVPPVSTPPRPWATHARFRSCHYAVARHGQAFL